MDTTESQNDEQVERDTFPVAFCVIATRQDFSDHAMFMMRSLPEDAQVCVLLNQQGEEESIGELKIQDCPKRTIRSKTWTYKPNTFSFSKARNLCHELTTKEWVFWIDCDEVIAHVQHDGIKQATAIHGGGVGGFLAGQASMSMFHKLFGAEEAEYANIAQLRMYRSNCGFEWEGHAHEQILPSIRKRGYTIVDSTITVIHNGYSGEADVLHAKLERNTSLIGRWLHENQGHELQKFYREIYCRDMNALINLEKKT